MLSVLLKGPKAIGLKQSQRAVSAGKARCAFVAQDADAHLINPFVTLCQQHAVPIERVATMHELGAVCGIHVGAAVAVALCE